MSNVKVCNDEQKKKHFNDISWGDAFLDLDGDACIKVNEKSYVCFGDVTRSGIALLHRIDDTLPDGLLSAHIQLTVTVTK